MIEKPLITIIIPFYNVEEKLFYNCLKSILGQSYDNFELIVVDDGSTEEARAFLHTVSFLDRRIRVIHKDNGGVSTARNYGVREAVGEYIAFIDADDMVHHEYLNQAFEIIERAEVDFVIGAIKDIFQVIEDETILSKCSREFAENRYKKYMNDEYSMLIPSLVASNSIIRFKSGGYINRGPVARLLRTAIAKKVLFPEGIPIGEDVIWNQYVLKECQSVAIAENIWYYYLQNEQSAVHRYRDDAVECIHREGIALFESLDTSKDVIYNAFCSRVFSETRLFVCRAYLTRKENRDGFFTNWIKFLKLKEEAPWSYISRRYFKTGDRKEKAIYLMFKSGLYFPVAYIKDRM